MRYLLDTNTVAYAFRGEGGVAGRLAATSPIDVGLPAPVLHEARSGILKLADGRRRDALSAALDRLAETVTVVPFDRRAAEAAARIRVALEAAGTPIGTIDLQIAAIGRVHDAIVVSRNRREFDRVDGLRVEDWYASAA